MKRFNTTLSLSLFLFDRSLFGHCLSLFSVCLFLLVIVFCRFSIVSLCLLFVVIMARWCRWRAPGWLAGPLDLTRPVCWLAGRKGGEERMLDSAGHTLRFQFRCSSALAVEWCDREIYPIIVSIDTNWEFRLTFPVTLHFSF